MMCASRYLLYTTHVLEGTAIVLKDITGSVWARKRHLQEK